MNKMEQENYMVELSSSEKKEYMQFFVSLFPLVECPFTINSDVFKDCSLQNGPFPLYVIENIISLIEGKPNEHTEYIPCFRIEFNKGLIGVVIAKIDLLEYQYIMMVLNKDGLITDYRVIAYYKVLEDHSQKSSTLLIESNGVMYAAEGASLIEEDYNPESTIISSFYIDEKGQFSDPEIIKA